MQSAVGIGLSLVRLHLGKGQFPRKVGLPLAVSWAPMWFLKACPSRLWGLPPGKSTLLPPCVGRVLWTVPKPLLHHFGTFWVLPNLVLFPFGSGFSPFTGAKASRLSLDLCRWKRDFCDPMGAQRLLSIFPYGIWGFAPHTPILPGPFPPCRGWPGSVHCPSTLAGPFPFLLGNFSRSTGIYQGHPQ